jgi:hypothetical protein
MNEPASPARSLSAGEKRAAYLCAAWVVVVELMLLAAIAFWIAEGTIRSPWIYRVTKLLFSGLNTIGIGGAAAWALYLGFTTTKIQQGVHHDRFAEHDYSPAAGARREEDTHLAKPGGARRNPT